MIHVKEPYKHPCGGLAQDVYVTRALFARTFGLHKDTLDNLPVRMRVMDKMIEGKEACGYVMKGPRGGKHFMITFIAYK